MTLMRPDLLINRTILLAGAAQPGLAEQLAALGAFVQRPGDEPTGAPAYALVYDAAGAFERGGVPAALDGAWHALHGIAGTLIEQRRGAKIILIGPRPNTGPFAAAARDALENLARTLSVEWARYAITATMIAPGSETTEEDLAELIGYLISRAGDYFSGCRFSLGAGR
jgi:hypothetical protein